MPLDKLSVTTRRVRLSAGHLVTVLLLLAIVAVAASIFLGPHGIRHLQQLRAERQQLGVVAVQLMQRNAALRDEVARLRGDDSYLEELARGELNLVRPDETVYRFRPRTGTAPP